MVTPLRRSLRLLKPPISLPGGAPPAQLLHSLLSRALLTVLTYALALYTAAVAALNRVRAAGAAVRRVLTSRCVFLFVSTQSGENET